ncbi:AAA family ATPase [Anaeromyxobacter oryzae]|uniref:MoxR-like ATPase n=1 Tax=Anaeromyxobacter oryzae TaxID=2918170 RepID=A0ABM7WYG3_9BACT|nr:MoxR family ATPase [Anaeromyxobacter oryzae]BDG04584.1 MoxR-like ATPase [Anaeromyxobacter oryzae]
MELQTIRDATARLRAEVHKVVVGQDRALDLMLVALLSDGHVLVEGVPGTAKTLLARAFAAALGVGFSRIQFTPDLMPGDVIGTNLFDFRTNAFVLTKGPIFTDVLVADEINRTPPKTQAALLQAMQERAVTIDGKTHTLSGGFMVLATQNPIEQEGTYPLPEAQLDRFLFKISVGYPARDEERDMVRVHGHRTATPPISEFGIEPVAGLEDLLAMRRTVAGIRLEEPIVDYVVDLVRATRGRPALLCGASPRAANMLATAARAHAAIQGRGFVIPDDVKALALPVLRHRVVLAPGAEIEGLTADQAVARVVEEVGAPR